MPIVLALVGVVLFVCGGLVSDERNGAWNAVGGVVRAPGHWRLGPMLGGGGHGWVVLGEELSGRPTQYRLMHLQPRLTGAGGGGGEEGDDGDSSARGGRDDTLGSIRLARVFSDRPEEIVWDGDRVYVVFPPVRGGGEVGRGRGAGADGETSVDADADADVGSRDVDAEIEADVGGSGEADGWVFGVIDGVVWEGGRRVLSVRAYQAPFGGRWETYPRGRMEPRAMLPGDGAIAGMAGTGRGPAALMRMGHSYGGETNKEGWLLLVLGRGGWAPVVLPWEVGGGVGGGEGNDESAGRVESPRNSSVLSLVPMPDGIGLLVREVGGGVGAAGGVRGEGAGKGTLWVGSWDQDSAGADGRLRVTWSARGLDLRVPAAPGSGSRLLDDVVGVEGHVVGWRWLNEAGGRVGDGAGSEQSGSGGGVVELYAARRVDEADGAVGGGASLLTRLEGVPATFWVVALGDAEDSSSSSVGGAGARLAVLWHEPAGDRGDTADSGVRRLPASLEMREVSVSTGRMLYSGAARVGGPVSGDEVRLLMAVMIAVTVVVLLFVLRPERRTARRTGDGLGMPGVVLVAAEPGALPESARVAGAGARLLAAVIDLGIATGLSMAIHGVGFGEVFGPVWPTSAGSGGAGGGGAGGSVVPLLTVLGLAAAIGSACEGLTGRTAGKWLTGCRVVTCWVRANAEVKRGDDDVSNLPFGGADDADSDVGSEGDGSGPVRADRDDGVVVAGPTWSQAVLRNVVKWGAPPLTMGVLLDPWRRHFGDLMGQTYVVESSPSGSEGEGVPASPTPGPGGES